MFFTEQARLKIAFRGLSLLLLVSAPILGFGQKEVKDYYLRKNIRHDGLQFQFTVLDDDRHGVWLYHRHKRYHWFKAQQVLSTEGASSGVLLHGNFEAFYGNKQLALRGRFNKGLKSGEWMEWYEDGSLKALEQWSNGRKRGEQIYYAADGKVNEVVQERRWSQSIYRNDSLLSHRGIRTEVRVYDENKRLASLEHFKHKVLHGEVVRYEAGRKVETLHYKNGVLQEPKVKEAKKEKTEADPKEEKESFFKRIFRKKEKTEKGEEKPKSPKEKNPKEPKVKKEKEPKAEKPEKEKKQKNTSPE